MFRTILVLALATAVLGSPLSDRTARIVGGWEAEEGQFPYQAAIRSLNPSSHFVCGGAILNARYILTAAHCVQFVNPADLEIRVGSTSNSNGEAFSVDSTLVHEEYDANNLNNDIALIRLSSPLTPSSRVSPVVLPTARTPAWTHVVFSGWGRTDYPSQAPSSSLRYLPMWTISQHDCDLIVGQEKIGGQNLCTLSHQAGGMDLYDDGGPLVKDGVLVGVASWSIPGGEGYPQVFTDVNTYMSWIFRNAAV